MQASNFEDLVNQCILSGFKHRMLYVFVRVAQMDAGTRQEMGIEDEDAAMVQVLFDAHQPAEMGLKFEQVRDVADAQSTDWTICVVTIAKNSDASLPTEEQAQSILADMRTRILNGDVDEFAVLDRDGEPLDVETADIPPM